MKHTLNCSTEHLIFLKRERQRRTLVLLLRFGLLFCFLALWEFLAVIGAIDTFIMSSPSRIATTLVSMFQQDLLYHIFVTLYETVAGFLIATVVGSGVAVLLWWSATLRDVTEPYLIVLNSLPKIALGPIIIIWCGAGTSAIIFMAVLISVIITVMSMLNAFLSVEEEKILLLRSMGANKRIILQKLILPASIPAFMSVLKINVGMAWVGSIMGEYLVSKAGLGYLIVYGGTVFKLDLVMSATVVLCVLAGLMYFLVSFAEKKVCKK